MRLSWPPHWQQEGQEPDYRFSLANERTFLAWLRTGLALMAGAVAIVQLIPPFWFEGARTVLGVMLAVIGLVVVLLAYLRWAAAERAMRTSQPLGYSVSLPVLTIALGLIGVLIVVLVAGGRR